MATFTTSTLTYGSHSVTAVYEGDVPLFLGSTSSPIGQFITSAGTQTTLTVEAVRNHRGKIVAAELVANIGVTSPGSGTAQGTAVFFVNGRAFYQAASVVDGTATLALVPVRATNKFAYARYLGYYNIFQPSVSTSLFISRRSLAAAPSVTEDIARSMVAEKSTADARDRVEIVKVVHGRSHR